MIRLKIENNKGIDKPPKRKIILIGAGLCPDLKKYKSASEKKIATAAIAKAHW
ncbi:hypothetical protein [Gloeocapsopsis dulcis]|uniref:hypothetical protein n=1 Tax=Gloeocapsopsis dulcis TaxID=2859516 RepID=UPI001379DE60|nr:hypothetical protein [Gloeocapsopsis dulcis]WNN90834.1 hypothetical protein P0S91_07090 [Gloeocapsopsis dulcis]